MKRWSMLVVATLLLAVITNPVGAAPSNPDGWTEIPINPAWDNMELWNPCTGETTTFFWEGKILVHEVENDNGVHTNMQFRISGWTSDGYTTPERMHVGLVENVNDNTWTYKDNSIYQYTNDAGSKFRMMYNEHWTVVDGEVVAEVFNPEWLVCVRYRG